MKSKLLSKILMCLVALLMIASLVVGCAPKPPAEAPAPEGQENNEAQENDEEKNNEK